MTDSQENRRVPRFSFPVLIDAPSLARHPLVPENISSTGFRVEVSEKPSPGDLVECAFVVNGKLFQGCLAKVRWVMNNEIFRSSWSVGLSVVLEGGRKGEFDAALKDVIETLLQPPG